MTTPSSIVQELQTDSKHLIWEEGSTITLPDGGLDSQFSINSATLDGGLKKVIASPLRGRGFLTHDEDNVYFSSDTSINRIDTDGLSPPAIIAFSPDLDFGAALIAGGDLIWAACSNNSIIVSKVSARGGPTNTLGVITAKCRIAYMALLDTSLFLVTNDDVSSLWSLPVTGGTPTAVVSNLNCPRSLRANSTGVYWVEGCQSPADSTNGSLNVLSHGTVRPLASGLLGVNFVAVDESFAYLPSRAGLIRISLDGATSQEVISQAKLASFLVGITVNSTAIYWGGFDAMISRIAK